jgi:hypothetical protein
VTAERTGVICRFYRKGDDEQILDVLTAAYGDWPQFELPVARAEHLRWKLEGHAPAVERHGVAEAGSRIVGVTLQLTRDINLDNGTLAARQSVDAAVHPDYQRQGIYARLDAFLHERLAPHFDLRISRTSSAAVLRTRQRNPGEPLRLGNDLRVFLKVLDARRLVPRKSDSHRFLRDVSLARALWFRALKFAGEAQSRPYRQQASWRIAEAATFDERIDGFCQEASRPFQFIAGRTRDYLNWRYCDPRSGYFSVLTAEEGERLLGYIVIRTSEERGYIADILALPGRDDVVASLVAAALERFVTANVAAVECWLVANHPYLAVIRRYGFVDSLRNLNFAYTPLGTADSRLDFLRLRKAPVHLTDGDLDRVV